MRRRDLPGLLLGAATAALAPAARAQQQRRIGFLSGISAAGFDLTEFRRGLKETGYITGVFLRQIELTAKALGLAIPHATLLRADEVIE